MPLSKHLYSLDEVQAAFSTSHRRPIEHLFWCQELLQSGCASESISILFESWLWQFGPFRLQWLIHAWNTLASDEVDEQAILLSTQQLSSLSQKQQDNSLSMILLLRLQHLHTIPDRITFKIISNLPFKDEKESYFINAMFQKKALSAWWISSYLSYSRIWELLQWYQTQLSSFQKEYSICLQALQEYDKLLGYRSVEYDIIIQCMAILIFCLSPLQQEDSFRPLVTSIHPSTINILEQWKSYKLLQEQRVYPIPISSLYGITVRGNSKWAQHNTNQLHNLEKYLIGCPYWEDVISRYGIIQEDTIQWNSEDAMEQFYDDSFPEGIPDEWNKDEKIKSHGNGVLGPDEIVTCSKFYSKYLSNLSRFVWNSSTISEFIKQIPFEESFPVSIGKQYLQISWKFEDNNLLLLKPVHKKTISK